MLNKNAVPTIFEEYQESQYQLVELVSNLINFIFKKNLILIISLCNINYLQKN